MEQTVIDSVQMGGMMARQHDLSMLGLFLQADILVKAVMVLLIGASVWSWAIIVDKALRLRRLTARAQAFEEQFWAGGSLDALYDQVSKNPPDPMSATFVAGMREFRQASDRVLAGENALRAGLQGRVDRVMAVTIGREMGNVESNMTFLASVGSTAPFVGLFGTVWGIMNSFTAIANTNNTSLVVVAPGIAEALFATALGLVAAIPAVMAYNKFSTDLGRYSERLAAFADEFSAILSRHLEDRV